MSHRSAVTVDALAVVIVFLAFRMRATSRPVGQHVAPVEVSLEDAATTGRVAAPVSLLVLCDFSSDGCAAFVRDVLPDITTQFVDPGRVRLAFRYRSATRDVHASRVAVCLGRDGSFWPFYEALFSATKQGVRSAADRLLTDPAYDKPAVRACLQSRSPIQNGDAEDMAAATLGPEVPAYLIGPVIGNRLSVRSTYAGRVPFSQLKRSIDSILAGARSAPATPGG
jgi:protein-disulfide isomerase